MKIFAIVVILILSIWLHSTTARKFYYPCNMEYFLKKFGLYDSNRACIALTKGTVYENANGYWPLYNDTVNLATGKGTQILGSNDGVIYETEGKLQYVTLDLSKTALNMGIITQYCLKSGSECKDGLTLSSWIKLRATDVGMTSVEVPIFTISGLLSSTANVAKVWITVGTAGQTLHVQIDDGFWRWEFVHIIYLSNWTHFSISFAKDIGLTVFIDGDMIRTAKVKRVMVAMPSSTYLTVGNISPGQSNVFLSLSKTAIWNTIIGGNESRNLYWDEVGSLISGRQCIFDNSTLNYYWSVPTHHYMQPHEFSIRWYSDQKDFNGPSDPVFTSTQNMTLKNIYRDTAYTFATSTRIADSHFAKKTSNYTCHSGSNGIKPRIEGTFTVVVLSSEKAELTFHPNPPSNDRIHGELRCYQFQKQTCYYRLNSLTSLVKEVDGLEARKFFNFTLLAWTDNRTENTFTTVALTYKSWEIAPGRVTNVQLNLITWHSIYIDWQGPKDSESHVIVYRISCYDNAGTNFTLYSPVPSLNITKLNQNTQYTLDIEVGNERSGYNHSLARKLKITTADRNECDEDKTRCGKNSECVNTKNSYTCRCNEGYSLVSQRCMPSVCSEHCPRETLRGIEWHCMSLNTEDVGQCPDGTLGVARRTCDDLPYGKVGWSKPDLSQCVSDWFMKFLAETFISDANITTLASDFKEVLEPKPQLFGGDMEGITDLMTAIVNEVAYNKKFINNTEGVADLRNVTTDIVEVASTILDKQNEKAWNDLPKSNMTNHASKVILSMEKLSITNAKSLEMVMDDNTVNINSINAVIKVSKLDRRGGNSELGSIENQIMLPNNLIRDNKMNTAAAYVSYKNMGNLLGAESTGGMTGKEDEVTSDVFSFSLVPKQNEPFDTPIVLIQKHNAKGNFSKPRCVFWQETQPNSGYWSDDGCNVNKTNTTHVTCHCYHLTNFAILMSVTDAGETMAAVHVFALRLISIICISISLVALFLAFITFWYFRQLKSSRTQLHKNLIVALFLAELLFIIGVDRIALGTGCNFIGIFLHYFFLVAFMLMGLEGVVLYMMLFQVYRAVKRGGYAGWKFIAVCWFAPLLIVGPTVAIDWEKYRTPTYCWISSERGFMWSFVGPVLAIILINIVFFVMAIRMMVKKSRKRDSKSSEIWRWMKGSSILLSILGLTWIIGLFYMNSQTIAIAYIFSIMNSLQGLGFFVFHCLADPRVRHAYRNLCCCVDKSAAYYSSSVFSKFSKFQNGPNIQANFKTNKTDTEISKEDATSMTNVDRLSDKQHVPMDVYEVELNFKTDGEMSDEEHDVPRVIRSPAIPHRYGVAM